MKKSTKVVIISAVTTSILLAAMGCGSAKPDSPDEASQSGNSSEITENVSDASGVDSKESGGNTTGGSDLNVSNQNSDEIVSSGSDDTASDTNNGESAGGAVSDSTPKEEDANLGDLAAIVSSDGLFRVSYNGVTLTPGENYAQKEAAMGNPLSYQAAANCFGLGDDKTFTYNDFVVYTEPNGTTDIVFLLELTGNTKTAAGVGSGDTLDTIKEKCGEPKETTGTYIRYISDSGSVCDLYYSGNTVNMVEIYNQI